MMNRLRNAFVASIVLLWGCLGLMHCSSQEPGNTGEGTLATTLPQQSVHAVNAPMPEGEDITFTLYNAGSAPFTISGFYIEGDRNTFRILSSSLPRLPVELEPGLEKGLSVTIKVKPSVYVTSKGRLLIDAPGAINADRGGYVSIPVIHQAVEPTVQMSCKGKLDFGAVAQGSKQTQTCELTNLGPYPLKVLSYAYDSTTTSSGFKLVKPANFTFWLKSEKQNTIKVEVEYVAPQEGGSETGSFLFATQSPKPILLKVAARSPSPGLQIEAIHDACSQDEECQQLDPRLTCLKATQGSATVCLPSDSKAPFVAFPRPFEKGSLTRSVVLRATGDAPVKVAALTLSPKSDESFSLDTVGLQLPFLLSPGEEKTLRVVFSAQSDAIVSGQLQIESNTGLRSVPILVSKTGCNLQFKPKQHVFGAKGETVKVTVENVGSAPCVWKGASLETKRTEPAFAFVSPPPLKRTLLPGKSFNLSLAFRPNKCGVYNNVLLVNSSDPYKPVQRLLLKGNDSCAPAKLCELSVSPYTLNFGTVPVGQAKSLLVSVENRGKGTCVFSSFSVKGLVPTLNKFFSWEPSLKSVSLAAGKATTFKAIFTPSVEGSSFQALLSFQSNDKFASSITLKSQGSAGPVCVEVIPSALDFASVEKGCSSPTKSVQLFHSGHSSCPKSLYIKQVKLSTNTSSEFSFVPQAPQLGMLTIEKPYLVSLQHKPTNVGQDVGTVEVEYTDSSGSSASTTVSISLKGQGLATPAHVEHFQQWAVPKADILFVIDHSSSTYMEQLALSNNMNILISAGQRLGIDFHIMVITMDTSTKPAQAGCSPHSPAYVTSKTTNVLAEMKKRVLLGTLGSGREVGLESAHKALSAPAITTCNKGFFRKDAMLSILMVSDDIDSSTQSMDFYIRFFQHLKGPNNPDLIQASVVAGLLKGCSGGPSGSATPAPRYWKFADSFLGLKVPICNTDWKSTMTQFAALSFPILRRQFPLSRPADASSVKVLVNGKTIAPSTQNGWSYDKGTNSIVFSQSSTPPFGAKVQVSYNIRCKP